MAVDSQEEAGDKNYRWDKNIYVAGTINEAGDLVFHDLGLTLTREVVCSRNILVYIYFWIGFE